MMREQGHLCSYTMAPIGGPESCHIEHIQPRSRHPGRATDYANMVLCVPGANSGRGDFGAIRKGDHDVTEYNFVSPLHPSCETRLHFKFSGEVAAAARTDLAAAGTIEVLALNHPSLVSARSDAIRLQGIGPRAKKPISAAKARRLIETIGTADAAHRIQPYCVAVRQAAEVFAKQCEDRARRMIWESAR